MSRSIEGVGLLKDLVRRVCNGHYKSKIVRNLILKNTEIIKQMGRINEVSEKSKHDKSFEILVLKEKLSLKFDENVDILSQKSKLENKINKLVAN